MKKILINFAHPARRRSIVNQALRAAVEGLENVSVNDLYAQYPDFMIDVEREQALCEAHEVILFQHPFYWYSTPAIIKEWQDLVLTHGWAYGSQATGLEGKYFLQVLTAGGDESTYHPEGYNEFTIEELTSPLKAMSKLCKMTWLPPFGVFGVHRGLAENKVRAHAEDYRKLVLALRDGTFDVDKAMKSEYCNKDLEKLIEREG